MSIKKLSAIRRSDPWLERELKRYEQPLPSREYLLQILEEQGIIDRAHGGARIAEGSSVEVAFSAREGRNLAAKRALAAAAREIDLAKFARCVQPCAASEPAGLRPARASCRAPHRHAPRLPARAKA